MDYEVLNQVIKQIIDIVNNYNKDKNYSYEQSEKLVLALFGYYLAMGEDIFTKINIILESLEIDYCPDFASYRKAYERHDSILSIDLVRNPSPVLKWNYQFDQDGTFKGATPQILYMPRDNKINEVLSLGHELMHALDGITTKYLGENDKNVELFQGFSLVTIDKRTGYEKVANIGMMEIAAIAIEFKILREFLKLDIDKIDIAFVKEFLSQLKQYKKYGTVLDSYRDLAVILKDLLDNDAFFELIKKYYMENDEESFKESFEAIDDGLSYEKFKKCIWIIIRNGCDIDTILYYGDTLKKQVDIFSKKTNFEPEKRLLLIV